MAKNRMTQHAQEQIRVAMMRAEMTQADMAAVMGCEQATVSRYLSGADMRMSVADRLAAALDMEWSGVNGLHLVPKATA